MTRSIQASTKIDLYMPATTMKHMLPVEDAPFVEVDLADNVAFNSRCPSLSFLHRADHEHSIAMAHHDQERAVRQDYKQHEIIHIGQDRPHMTIWQAAELGDMGTLRYILETHTADPAELINLRDPDTECTLLHLVIAHNPAPLSLLQFLLDNGANASARNVYNVQAIHTLPLYCPEPLAAMKLLIDHEADVNARDGDSWTPLHYAARFCKNPDAVMHMLLQHGADINALDRSNKSPLFSLLANGDFAHLLDALIHEAKAKVDILADFLDQRTRKSSPGTVLLQAAKYGRVACMGVLLASTTARNALRDVVTKEELDHALAFSQARSIECADLSDGVDDSSQKMTQLLREFKYALEQDATSALAQSLDADHQRQLVRRQARRSFLGSIRQPKSFCQFIDTQASMPSHQGVTRRPSLLKRMARLLTGEVAPTSNSVA